MGCADRIERNQVRRLSAEDIALIRGASRLLRIEASR
jgi:hypothetical protein